MSKTPPPNCQTDNTSLQVPLAIFYALFFLFGLSGNLLALWVFLRVHPKKNSVCIFLINLALADVLLVICLPFRVVYHSNNNRTCMIKPEESHETILPWLYLTLAALGLPTNGIVLVDLWRSERTPTIIFTLNIIISDLLMCCSFFFRIAYYKENTNWQSGTPACNAAELIIFSCFYINLYCNMCFLLWTSINRYTTVVKPGYALFQVFKQTRPCWILCFSTWLIVITVVGASMGVKLRLQINGTCFDQVVNSYVFYQDQFNTIHCLGVSAFFFILCLMLVSYSMLVFHLQKVRGGSLVGVGYGPGGGLKVRRKILASVIMFVLCFLPYHVQRINLLTSEHENCQVEFRIKMCTIFIAALSCCLHPVLQLVFRSSCCRANRNNRAKPKPDISKSLVTPQMHTINVTEHIEEPKKNETELSHKPTQFWKIREKNMLCNSAFPV